MVEAMHRTRRTVRSEASLYERGGGSCRSQSSMANRYLHIASHTWISINPPRASNSGLLVEDPELVETEVLFQPTSHRNAGLASADDQDGEVGITIGIIAVLLFDRPAIRWAFA